MGSLYQSCLSRYSPPPMLYFSIFKLRFSISAPMARPHHAETPRSAPPPCRFRTRLPRPPPPPPPSLLHRSHPQTAVRGRPNLDWGQDLLHKIYCLSGMSSRDVGRITQDRRQFHQLVERLCS